MVNLPGQFAALVLKIDLIIVFFELFMLLAQLGQFLLEFLLPGCIRDMLFYPLVPGFTGYPGSLTDI